MVPAFVPRLGKRLDSYLDSQRHLDSLGRLVCENSRDCGQLALLGALVRDFALDDDSNQQLLLGVLESANLSGDLLRRLVAQDQLVARRETRASLDGAASASGFGGAKRVAFTPRIGR